MLWPSWRTIPAKDYHLAFERFGGSFAVHPRVVALVAGLAKRPVRYAGLIRRGELVAAVPLWGEHIAATKLALEFYQESHLIDIGDSEVVIPVDENVRIALPYMAEMISNLHSTNISNVDREAVNFTIAKGLKTGDLRISGKSQSKRRRELRRFEEAGGSFLPIADLTADEVAAIYIGLYKKRRGCSPQGEALLPTVMRELKDLLCGDVLFFNGRPMAIEVTYKHTTPRWLFVNGVQRGLDPEFTDHSLGTILLFHNLGLYEEEASRNHKTLRYCFGWNDDPYKALWTYEVPAYRLAAPANSGVMRSLIERVTAFGLNRQEPQRLPGISAS